MRTVICPHCNEPVSVPDDLARAFCVRCGKVIAMMETHVTSEAPPPVTQAIQPQVEAEWTPRYSQLAPEQRTEPYADWDDFRANAPTVQRELMELATRPLPDLHDAVRRPLPADSPDAVEQFGEPLATIHVPGEGWVSLAVGWFFFLGPLAAFLACGIMSFMAPPRGDDIAAMVFMGLFYGGPFMMLGTWLVFFRGKRRPITLWIFENGLLRKRGGRFHACAWEAVDDFQVNQETGRPYFVVTVQGKTTETSPALDPSVGPLMDYVEIKLSTAKFLPTLRRLFDGESVKFGEVMLDRAGLTAPRFYAQWSDIDRVDADLKYFFVGQRHRQDWYQVRYRDVSFPLLLLAVAHVMIAEEKRLPVNPT